MTASSNSRVSMFQGTDQSSEAKSENELASCEATESPSKKELAGEETALVQGSEKTRLL